MRPLESSARICTVGIGRVLPCTIRFGRTDSVGLTVAGVADAVVIKVGLARVAYRGAVVA